MQSIIPHLQVFRFPVSSHYAMTVQGFKSGSVPQLENYGGYQLTSARMPSGSFTKSISRNPDSEFVPHGRPSPSLHGCAMPSPDRVHQSHMVQTGAVAFIWTYTILGLLELEAEAVSVCPVLAGRLVKSEKRQQCLIETPACLDRPDQDRQMFETMTRTFCCLSIVTTDIFLSFSDNFQTMIGGDLIMKIWVSFLKCRAADY